jgi:hypothetical protein
MTAQAARTQPGADHRTADPFRRAKTCCQGSLRNFAEAMAQFGHLATLPPNSWHVRAANVN